MSRPFTVHPRWRGEHMSEFEIRVIENGSSPLARGALCQPNLATSRRRFIPAGAGSTLKTLYRPPHVTVHPRWRGEHMWMLSGSSCGSGSSPLARGARAVYSVLTPRQRFIPAGAGSTTVTTRNISAPPVHPRWRGEHQGSTFRYVRLTGSSPLARGALLIPHHV